MFSLKNLARVLACTLAVTVGSLSSPSRADAMWAHWSQSVSNITSYSQVMRIDAIAPATFWSSQFNFVEQPASGGYIGMQRDGYAFELGVGEIAIFSLWDAVHAVPAPGAVCGAFGGEGEGLSCRARIGLVEGHRYKVIVTRSAGTRSWTEFTGEVRDLTARKRYRLGTIRVRGKITLQTPSNFIEYFGPTLACQDRPYATAKFDAPVVRTGGRKPLSLTAAGFSTPGCAQEVGISRAGSALVYTGR